MWLSACLPVRRACRSGSDGQPDRQSQRPHRGRHPRRQGDRHEHRTNISREAETSSTGDYLIPLLRPGSYKLVVGHAGFKTYQRGGITLEINQRARVDIILEVGQVSDRVEVTAEVPAITTESATVGKVIDNKSITMMPLNGRLNIAGLMALAPGIQNPGSQTAFRLRRAAHRQRRLHHAVVAFTLDGVTKLHRVDRARPG